MFQFYCPECVIGGDFVHSNSCLCERFCEKQLRFFSLQRDISSSKEEISALANKKWTVGQLKENIKVTKTKIKYLRHVIKQNVERKVQNSELLQRYKESNRKRQERLPSFEDKAVRMNKFVDNFVSDMRGLKEKEMGSQLDVRRIQADWILQLHDFIFPVEHVEADPWPQEAGGHDTSDRMMMECLADAMRTSYISGRWVNSDYRDTGGEQYQIVSGQVAQDHSQHNIAAAHTLAAQFTQLAAGILQLPLPVKLSWADLGVIETSEARLARKVSKLNVNMIRLCLDCGVDVRMIRPTQCLHNLYNIVQTLRSYNTVKLPGPAHDNHEQLLDVLQSQVDSEPHCSGGETDSESEDEADIVWGGGPGGTGGGWESVTSDQVANVECSPPPAHSSIASSVSNTVSQFLWGFSAAPPTATPHQSPQTNKK